MYCMHLHVCMHPFACLSPISSLPKNCSNGFLWILFGNGTSSVPCSFSSSRTVLPPNPVPHAPPPAALSQMTAAGAITVTGTQPDEEISVLDTAVDTAEPLDASVASGGRIRRRRREERIQGGRNASVRGTLCHMFFLGRRVWVLDMRLKLKLLLK